MAHGGWVSQGVTVVPSPAVWVPDRPVGPGAPAGTHQTACGSRRVPWMESLQLIGTLSSAVFRSSTPSSKSSQRPSRSTGAPVPAVPRSGHLGQRLLSLLRFSVRENDASEHTVSASARAGSSSDQTLQGALLQKDSVNINAYNC